MPSINNFLKGFQNNLPGMKDYRHATRLFLDDNFKLAPKQKFLFHVIFDLDERLMIKGFSANEQYQLNTLVKNCELPRYGFNLEEKIQYNKKMYAATRIQYEPVNITFHDDNADIVKDVYGGVIDILMKEKNIQKAIDFTKECLQNIVDEKYPLDKLIISKSLRGYYKVPKQIAHKVLADRIGKRDPGNKPSVGDRIPFVYIHTKGKKVLQGEKIESPEYIIANNIKPDYSFYITNQIMKPLQQVFALVLEKIPAFKKDVRRFRSKIAAQRRMIKEDEKFIKKEADMRNKAVKELIFDDYLRQSDNMKRGLQNIKGFFGN